MSKPVASPTRSSRALPAEYEITLAGRLGEGLAAAFAPLTAMASGVNTTLAGTIQDQSALHAVLDRVMALGIELIELRRVGPTS